MAFRIAYGAGHYLGTAGKRLPPELDPAETKEWVLNDRVARYFAEAATAYKDVELLRVDDPTGQKSVSLAKRCDKANAWRADLCLAIHHNAGINLGNGGGIVAYTHPKDADAVKYRDAIYAACIAATGLAGNRANPMAKANFYVLSATKAPAVLMEYGFMDSRTDAPVILTDEYARSVASATMDAIAQVAGLEKGGTAQQVMPKTIDQLAGEVIDGKHGNGEDRKKSLSNRYQEVQDRVNEILRGNKPKLDIDTIALEVIDGKYGNGTDRKNRLAKEFGAEAAAAIQNRVNQMLRG